MKITIDDNICKKHLLDLQEVLAILLVKTGTDINTLIHNMIDKEILVNYDGQLMVTQRWNEECEDVLLSSEEYIPTTEELNTLAVSMMQLMPPGKMPGTAYYYKCNKREITLKLKKFFKLYGKYEYDDIIAATKKYVDSFNGDYRYMKLLKYFIMKDERRINSEGRGYVEETSMLATILENKDGEASNETWASEIR